MAETKCGFDDVPGGASGRDLLVHFGPTLVVDIGFDPNFAQNRGIIPLPGLRDIHALVDTGAAESCIDKLLANQLNLPKIDRRPVAGVHGSQEVDFYLAQINVKYFDNRIIYGAFAGVDLTASGQVHSALIGRTFLQHVTMVYEGRTGSVTLSI